MHELSIAHNIIEIGTEHASAAGAARVTSISLRVGALSCVHQSALEFSFEVVAQDTLLEGASLKIEIIPVVIYCQQCEEEVELPGIQSFRCPSCNTASGDIRQGQEIEVDSMEILDGGSEEID